MELSKKRITEEIEYYTVRSKRRSVGIEVNREKGVILRLPLSFPEKDVEKLILKNKAWILKTLEKQKTLPPKPAYTKTEKSRLKKRAETVIFPLVTKYSKIMGLNPSAVKINFAKTRFGSCSPKNSLNFSAYLLEYPFTAIEYVVVHELAHIKHRNHGLEFYKFVEKYLPDYKSRIKLLKR